MDRAEKGALGVATIGHVALFGLLSVGFLATPNPLELKPKPIEVVLTDEVGLTSAAPDPSTEMPAERLAEIEGPVEPVAPPPSEALPTPPQPEAPTPAPTPPRTRPAERAPAPKATPKPPAKPAPKREAAKPKAERSSPARETPTRERARPTGRLSGITDGLSDRASDSSSTRAKATQTAAQARQSINLALGSQIGNNWRPPTGADAEKLVSVVQFDLNRDGSLAGAPRLIGQRGKTASNAPQQQLHGERAIRAVRVSAPFKLPPELYDQWRTWRLDFDARLN